MIIAFNLLFHFALALFLFTSGFSIILYEIDQKLILRLSKLEVKQLHKLIQLHPTKKQRIIFRRIKTYYRTVKIRSKYDNEILNISNSKMFIHVSVKNFAKNLPFYGRIRLKISRKFKTFIIDTWMPIVGRFERYSEKKVETVIDFIVSWIMVIAFFLHWYLLFQVKFCSSSLVFFFFFSPPTFLLYFLYWGLLLSTAGYLVFVCLLVYLFIKLYFFRFFRYIKARVKVVLQILNGISLMGFLIFIYLCLK